MLTCERTINDKACGAHAVRAFFQPNADPRLRLNAFCTACAEWIVSYSALWPEVDVREVDMAALECVLKHAQPIKAT